MIAIAWEWIQANGNLLWFLGISSLAMFIGTLILIPLIIVRMRADYFVRKKPPADTYWGQHPLVRMIAHVVKNLFGIIFIVAGLAMLVLPGQGILTMLIGITLMDFPGKQRLELWIIRQPAILKTVNWIRTRAGKAVLEVPG